MNFKIVPLEERIVLDAAAAVAILAAAQPTEHAATDTQAQTADSHVTDATTAAPSQSQPLHVLVVASNIQDPQGLINAAQQGVITITYDFQNTTLSQLEQMIEKALNGKKADSIAIAAEGYNGLIDLTNTATVNENALRNDSNMQAFWKSIGGMLADGGRVDLLSCNLAGDQVGTNVVVDIQNLINNGGDYLEAVAASTHLLGNINGATWLLDVGNINAESVYFNSEQLSLWHHDLATLTQYAIIVAQLGFLADPNGILVMENGSITRVGVDSSTLNIQVDLVTGTSHGTLIFNSNQIGGYTYTPDVGYLGTDSFTFKLTNLDTGQSNNITAHIAVSDQLPAKITAVDQSYVIHVNTLLPTNTMSGAITSYYDPAGLPLTNYFITSRTVGGTVFDVLNIDTTNGTFTYVASQIVSDTGAFTYIGYDAHANKSNAATIRINSVDSTQFLPTVEDYIALENSSINGNVLSYAIDPATSTLVTGPTHGTLSLASDGAFTYTPNAGYYGTDTFVFASGSAANTTVTMTVVPLLPTSVNDSFTTSQNTAVNGSVLGNDSDPNGLALTAKLSALPFHGTVTMNSDGTFTYTPNAGFVGTDTFKYGAVDANGNSINAATVTINVNPVGSVANNDTYSVNENSTLSGASILSNDTGTGTLTANLVTSPTHGALTLNTDGTFTYIPTANFVGADSFTYTANDANGVSNIATVTINVNLVNEPIIAQSESYTAIINTTLNGTSVLANDTDPKGLPMTANLVSGPSGFVLNPDGTFAFTSSVLGTFQFTYNATDAQGDTSANITDTIVVIPQTPVANNDSYTITENGSLINANVLTNDTNLLGPQIQIDQGPAHGTLNLNLNASPGTFTYIPNANFYGTDTFTYEIVETAGVHSNIATVTITVTPLPPTANNDSYTTTENSTLNGTSVLANDTTINGQTLSAEIITSTTNGNLMLNGDGTFSYTPNANFYGTDSFTYRATDGLGDGGSNTATVTITINPLPPTANNDTYSTNINTSLNGTSILANDTNINGQTLTAQLISGTTHGTLILNADGTFNYTPNTNFTGLDSFTYKAIDGLLDGGSNIATATISVTGVVPPTANADSFTTLANTAPTTFTSVLANDTDPQNLALSAQLVTGPTHALSFVLNSDGTFTYQATPGFTGTDSFTYKAIDTFGGTSNIATATIVSQSTVTSQPILDLKGNINSTFVENKVNKDPDILAKNVKITDSNTTTFDNGYLFVNLAQNGTVDDRLIIQQNCDITTDAAHDVFYKGQLVGIFTGGVGLTPLEIIFNGNATKSIVEQITEQVAFTNVSDLPSTLDRSVQFILADGKSGISDPAYRTIHVFRDNDPPQINLVDGTLTVAEHQIVNIGLLSGISITDIGDYSTDLIRVVLSVSHGYLDFTNDLSDLTSIVFKKDPGNGIARLDFTGTLADVNAALSRLTYVSRGNYTGYDTVRITATNLGAADMKGAPTTDQDLITLKIVA